MFIVTYVIITCDIFNAIKSYMLFVLGIVVVMVSVISGYTMHYGDLRLLWQPYEFVIIIGAGIGSVLISSPFSLVKRCCKAFTLLFKTEMYSKDSYLETLDVFYKLVSLIKAKGLVAAEKHIESPKTSSIISNTKYIINDTISINLLTDSLRIVLMGMTNINQVDEIIERDIQTLEGDNNDVTNTVLNLGDSLPALGIVAAVLGVIVTMRSIGEPPAIMGSLIAAALVGTFTGVLLAYGLVNPVGHYLERAFAQQSAYWRCIKSGIKAYLEGHPPIIIIESMRKSIPEDVRPNFSELENLTNEK